MHGSTRSNACPLVIWNANQRLGSREYQVNNFQLVFDPSESSSKFRWYFQMSKISAMGISECGSLRIHSKGVMNALERAFRLGLYDVLLAVESTLDRRHKVSWLRFSIIAHYANPQWVGT
jgi:hypothetical protein